MKTTLLLILPLLLCVIACDDMDIKENQSESFIKYFSNYPNLIAADVKQLNNEGYAILGTAGTASSGNQICLLRTDKYGNTIADAHVYGRSSDDQAYCLQVLSDGGFGILGSSVNPENGNKEVLFIRTNSAGDSLWSKLFKGTYDIEAYHFEVDANESFYLIGYADTLVAGTINKDIWLSAFDNTGIALWPAKKQGGSKDDIGSYLQIMDNGELILTGQTNSHAFVCKADDKGKIITGMTTFAGLANAGTCVKIDDDDNIYLTGYSTSSTTLNTDILLAKVRYNLYAIEIFWVKNFGQEGNDDGKSLLIDNESVTVLGTTTTGGSNTSIALLTVGQDGTQDNFKKYGQVSQLSSSAFEKTYDNGFIITGTNKLSEDNYSIVLIKTHADGSLY